MNNAALLRVTLGVGCAVLVLSASTVVRTQSSRTVIASALDNPRGLAFGPDGALYIVEAGRGGTSTLCGPEPAAPPGTLRCYGPTGAITRILPDGDQRRVVVGLPSLAVASGNAAGGAHDIGFGMGAAWVTIGFGGDPAGRAAFEAAGVRLGRLVRIGSTGQWSDVVDIAAHEAATNPAGGPVDSNPYGLLVRPDAAVIADAGANALVRVAASGAITTLAVFPPRFVPSPFGAGSIPMEAVPTTVAQAPDGSYFVGELTGFPFPVGGARVYRVPAGGGTPVSIAEGFTNIIDIAVDGAGAGYVLEHDANSLLGPGSDGRLIRINADGTRTVMSNANLTAPGGLAIGPDGAVYVTNRSTSAGGGEVIRLVP